MKESAVETAIRKHAELKGCVFLKLAPVPGSNGKPDRLVLAPGGKAMFLELKKPGEKLEPLQEWWQRRLRSMGHVSEWCDNAAVGKKLIDDLTS